MVQGMHTQAYCCIPTLKMLIKRLSPYSDQYSNTFKYFKSKIGQMNE